MKVVDDAQIAALLAERKPAVDPSELLPKRRKRGHLEGLKEVVGAEGSKFRLVVRQSLLDVQDFSAIRHLLETCSFEPPTQGKLL